MSDLIGFEVPKIDWTQGPDLVQRFRRFKQKCELLFEGPLKPRTDEQKCKYLLLWTGDYGLDLFNTWNFREELTIEDGLILKGDRIVVPTSLRKEILSIIHQGHLGQEKCLLRARTSVFWPGLTKDVVDLAKECDPCQRHQNKQQKQPILQPEPPNYPWQRLNSDLFEFIGHQYLLVSDQYSKFPVIRKLSSTTSQAIITHLKSIFAEHGIPAQLVSDNGPQYSAKEFQDFTEYYGIEHITSSPHYPQANGSSERMVQTVKNILTKCDEEGGDPYLALLSYRATPISHHLDSPAQLLTKRKFKTLLPMSNRASCTADSGDVKEQLKKQQEYYGQYYNQKAGPALKPLHPGQPVRVLDHRTQTWQPGTVLRAAKEPRRTCPNYASSIAIQQPFTCQHC